MYIFQNKVLIYKNSFHFPTLRTSLTIHSKRFAKFLLCFLKVAEKHQLEVLHKRFQIRHLVFPPVIHVTPNLQFTSVKNIQWKLRKVLDLISCLTLRQPWCKHSMSKVINYTLTFSLRVYDHIKWDPYFKASGRMFLSD